MSINWFTFGAQIVNFAIVLWLLRRFLYGPILSVMKEREAKIASSFLKAETMTEQAHNESERYQTACEELAAVREAYLAEAEEKASDRRKSLVAAARQEVDQMQANWYAAVQQEKQRFLLEVQTRMGDAVYNIARDALKDLANAELEDAIVGAFLDKVQYLEPDPRNDDIIQPTDVRTDEQVFIVRSAFPLSAQSQEQIERTLTRSASLQSEFFDPELAFSFTFQSAPELLCGIETQFYNKRIAWNLRDYLDSYADHLDATLVAGASERAHAAMETQGLEQ